MNSSSDREEHVTHTALDASVARRLFRPFSVERYTALSKADSCSHEIIEHTCIGPFFVAFPNLREALQNNIPIKTQARSCTILPNFVGCADYMLHSMYNVTDASTAA